MKKLISIILCAALALAALTACGSTAAPTPTAEPVQTAEPTPEATPEPTAEPTPTPTPEPTPEPVTDPLVMYKDILDVYAQALTNNYGGEELTGSEISLLNMYCYEGNALDNVGYIFLDLDGDGTMELFIGAIGGDEFVANAVFDFYTYQDGHPVLLLDSMERARCYICDDNTLVIDGANSAFNTEYSCYSYANGTLTEIEPVESAYQQLDYTPFSQYGAWPNTPENIAGLNYQTGGCLSVSSQPRAARSMSLPSASFSRSVPVWYSMMKTQLSGS